MAKWRVTIPQWEREIEADDEGYALMEGESRFSFMSEARAEEILPDEEDDEC